MFMEIMNLNRLLWWLPWHRRVVFVFGYLIMKSAILRAVQPAWGKRILCYDYVHLDNLSDISAYRNHKVQQCKMQIPQKTHGLKLWGVSIICTTQIAICLWYRVNSILNKHARVSKCPSPGSFRLLIGCSDHHGRRSVGTGGRVPPLFRVGDSIGIVPPLFSSEKMRVK